MKYFTPELYVQFNEAPDNDAEAVHDEWQRVGRKYSRRYRKIEPHLPKELRRFHDEQCLHDADVVGPALLTTRTTPRGAQKVTIVAEQINTLVPEFLNTIAILEYTVTEPPLLEKPVEAKVFSSRQVEWMYDEIDLVEPGVFSHSIFLSTGVVVTIRFRAFNYRIARLLTPVPNGAAIAQPRRRTAST
jgi:hypothetical protein